MADQFDSTSDSLLKKGNEEPQNIVFKKRKPQHLRQRNLKVKNEDEEDDNISEVRWVIWPLKIEFSYIFINYSLCKRCIKTGNCFSEITNRK